MKKVFAILLAAVLVMALSVTAFAAGSSPEGVSYYKVHIIDGNGSKTQTEKIPVGEEITLKADPDKGDFDEWKIFKADGSIAVAGKDYEIVSGSLTKSPLVIIPMANLIITANYDGEETDFEIDNGEVTSPQTGDVAVYALCSVMVLALAGAVVAKKQLVK